MRKNAKVNEALAEIADSLSLVHVHSIVIGMRYKPNNEYDLLFLDALQARIDKEQDFWLENESWRELAKKRRSEARAEALLATSAIERLPKPYHPA
jgi:hypothetical protein